MAGETQIGSRRVWASALVGVAVGGVAGWVLGRAAAWPPAGQASAPVAGFGVVFGLLVLGFVVAVLAVAAAVMWVSPKRRHLTVPMGAAAAGWVGGYAVALWMA